MRFKDKFRIAFSCLLPLSFEQMISSDSKEKFLAYGAWAAVCIFWGTTYLAIRICLETIPPFLMGGFRFLTAGSILFFFMRFVYRARLPSGKEWRGLGFLGILMLAVGNGVVVWTEQYIPSGMTALLVATFPFWVAGLESFLTNGERITLRVLCGMLLGFMGLFLLVAPNLFGTNINKYFIIGVIALQVGCISWAAASVYIKHNPIQVPSLMGAAVQMLAAGLALTALGVLKGELPSVHFSVKTFAALSYLILFGSIVAFSSYNYAIQKLPLSLVSMYAYINPVIAVLLGWVLLAEPFGWQIALATAIILSGVALVKGKSKRKDEEEKTIIEEIELSVPPESCVTRTG